MQIDRSHTSPNYSSRQGRAISIIVLHATVGGFRSSLNWLTTPASRVSTGYLIDKDGKIYQLVDDAHAAWHAGAARWREETDINERSIGIELVNANTGRDPYPRVQFEAAVELTRSLITRYHIDPANVVRHLDIAIPKGRKTDPAGFDWSLFRARIGADGKPYRVRHNVVANIRTGPAQNKPVVGVLSGGDTWRGVQVRGQAVKLQSFGASDIWIVSEDGRAVWSLLLET